MKRSFIQKTILSVVLLLGICYVVAEYTVVKPMLLVNYMDLRPTPLPTHVEVESGFTLIGSIPLPDGLYVLSHQQTQKGDWCYAEWYTNTEFEGGSGFPCENIFIGDKDGSTLGDKVYTVSMKDGILSFSAENSSYAEIKKKIDNWFMNNIHYPIYAFWEQMDDRSIPCQQQNSEGYCFITIRSEKPGPGGVKQIKFYVNTTHGYTMVEAYEEEVAQYIDFVTAYKATLRAGRDEIQRYKTGQFDDPVIRGVEISVSGEDPQYIENPH